MTEMFEVSPLSPVREWAIARSRCGISALHDMDGGPHQMLRQQGRADADDLSRRFGYSAAARWAVEVERFYLVGDTSCLAEAVGAAHDPDPHLARLRRAGRQPRSEDGVDADQVETQLAGLHTGQA